MRVATLAALFFLLTSSAVAPAQPLPDLEQKLRAAKVEAERVVAERAPPGISEAELAERRSLLQSIVRSYERELGARDQLAQAERRSAALEKKVAAGSGLPRGPYSRETVDELRDGVQAAAKKLSATEAKLALMLQRVDSRRERLQDAEAKLRLAQE